MSQSNLQDEENDRVVEIVKKPVSKVQIALQSAAKKSVIISNMKKLFIPEDYDSRNSLSGKDLTPTPKIIE